MPTLILPDIADNCSLREAEAKLKALGFKLGATEYVVGEKDWVVGVKCRGHYIQTGEQVPVDALVVLVVGNSASDSEEELLGEDSWTDSIPTLDDMNEIEIEIGKP